MVTMLVVSAAILGVGLIVYLFWLWAETRDHVRDAVRALDCPQTAAAPCAENYMNRSAAT